MKNKNKRVRFVEADNVCSSGPEPYASEMVNNVKTMINLDRPKTSEYKFYKRALEEASCNFSHKEGPKKEDPSAKLTEEISSGCWRRNWENRSLLPTDHFAPSCQSASPHVSQTVASRGFCLCAVEPSPCTSSQCPQYLASRNIDIHDITLNCPCTVSQVSQIVASRGSGMQYQHGQIFSIKRRSLRQLAAKVLSLCLDDFVSLGSDAILELLQRIGIQKDARSNTKMLSAISKTERFNGDDTDSNSYPINRPKSSIPREFYQNGIPRYFNFKRACHSELGSPAFQGVDAEVPILFSPSANLIPPKDSIGFSLAWPDFFAWSAGELHNGRYKAHEMMLESIESPSECAFLGISEPLHVTSYAMDSFGKFTETLCPRRSKYFTVADMPSDLALLNYKSLPYFQWNHLNEPLFETDAYNIEEKDSKVIDKGLENLDSRSHYWRLLLDGNYGTEAPDVLVPKSRITHFGSEPLIMWLSDKGVDTFNFQNYDSRPGFVPGIRLHDFYSNCNMMAPREKFIEDDNFQHGRQSSLTSSAENWHYLAPQEGTDLIGAYDGNNLLLCTPSTSKYISGGLLHSGRKYLLPPPGMNSDLKSPLALDYSHKLLGSSDLGTGVNDQWQVD